MGGWAPPGWSAKPDIQSSLDDRVRPASAGSLVIEPHSFQLVSIWVEYKRTVVARIVIEPIARWPIIGPADRQSSSIESIYGVGIWRVKRNVDATSRVRRCATKGYVCPEFGEVQGSLYPSGDKIVP